VCAPTVQGTHNNAHREQQQPAQLQAALALKSGGDIRFIEPLRRRGAVDSGDAPAWRAFTEYSIDLLVKQGDTPALNLNLSDYLNRIVCRLRFSDSVTVGEGPIPEIHGVVRWRT
jgi:hypothetical protein